MNSDHLLFADKFGFDWGFVRDSHDNQAVFQCGVKVFFPELSGDFSSSIEITGPQYRHVIFHDVQQLLRCGRE